MLACNREPRKLMISKLQLDWSPEQMAGWLPENYAHNGGMQISHETIYKTLYFRSRKTLDHLLTKHLRRSRRMRQIRNHSRSGDRGIINIVNGVSIHNRPKSIESRKQIGLWEGDLVMGSGNTNISTLVDRETRFTLILKLKGKDSASVNRALIHILRKPWTMLLMD